MWRCYDKILGGVFIHTNDVSSNLRIYDRTVDNNVVTFKIPVAPVAKGRPRLGRWGVYTPEKTRAFENEIKLFFKVNYKAYPFSGPLGMSLTFYLNKPKTNKREYPDVRSDVDNYIKSVMDALNGILYEDDSQIIELHALKRYGTPGIELSVWKI